MKYLMLIYSNPETWGHPSFLRTKEGLALREEERRELTAELEALFPEMIERGELVGGGALADPTTATIVKVREGSTVLTDGPYLETKEQMAGVFVVDFATPERAVEVAARFPEARFSGVELRPIMDLGGEEM